MSFSTLDRPYNTGSGSGSGSGSDSGLHHLQEDLLFSDSVPKRRVIRLAVWQFYLLISVLLATAILAFLGWVLHAPGSNDSSSSAPTLINYGASYEIGSPPALPRGSWARFTILHMNDVYELMPLNGGKKGGLARVATIRQLLMQENPNILTTLGGDLVSPSALGTTNMSTIDGQPMNGRQMIATMNQLGLDVATFGNHEMDLNRADTLARISESKFEWISLNVIDLSTGKPLGGVAFYTIRVLDGIRVLLFGLTIDNNLGTIPKTKPVQHYVNITNAQQLVPQVKQFFASLNDQYDYAIALTHLDLATDVTLAESIPQIDLILGGHEHVDYAIQRGPKWTPIFKADDNAFSVWALRIAINRDPNAKPRTLIHSTLIRVTPDFPDEPKTAAVAQYWFNLGMDAFRAQGYDPTAVVTTIPEGVVLDGRSDIVREQPTLLTAAICDAMTSVTQSMNTTIGLFNTGAIRIDDFLTGTVTQYDILRTLPYGDPVVVLNVKGADLATVLTAGLKLVGQGMYLAFSGVSTPDNGETWLDSNGHNIAEGDQYYSLATGLYVATHVDPLTTYQILGTFVTNTKALIQYLPILYPTSRV